MLTKLIHVHQAGEDFVFTQTRRPVCRISGAFPYREREEFAKLFAGAPELLAALQYALEFLEANDDGEDDVVNRIASARAAIAKAKGH
jgi:hypothetical protein